MPVAMPKQLPWTSLDDAYAAASFMYSLTGPAGTTVSRKKDGNAPDDLEVMRAKLALTITATDSDFMDLLPPTLAHRWEAVARHLDNKAGAWKRIAWPNGFFPVEVRPSRLHGKGVFTTRDVLPGEPLSLYPPDALTFRRISKGSGPQGVVAKWTVPHGHSAADFKAMAEEYSFNLGTPGTTCVQVVGFPELCDDPAYLAHMANDPVGPVQSEGQYNKMAFSSANASFVRVFSRAYGALIACRPIPAGSEVLVPYTHGFWTGRHQAAYEGRRCSR